MPKSSPSSACVRPRAMRALVRSSPKESRSSALKESRRPSLRSSYSEISRSRSSNCIRRASITAEATLSRSAEWRPSDSFCSSVASSESCSLLWRYSLSLRIMPSPPCLRFHREHAPLTALAVGLEEPQEGLTGSQLRSRGGEEVHTKPPLSLGPTLGPTLGIRREDWSQAAQVLSGNLLRQIVAAYSQSLGRSLSVTKLQSKYTLTTPQDAISSRASSSPSSNSRLLRLHPIFSSSSSRSVSWTPGGSSPSSVNCGITRLSIQHFCCISAALPSRKVTATVLQPGCYGHVRDRRAAAANLVKHLQKEVITGQHSTG